MATPGERPKLNAECSVTGGPHTVHRYEGRDVLLLSREMTGYIRDVSDVVEVMQCCICLITVALTKNPEAPGHFEEVVWQARR